MKEYKITKLGAYTKIEFRDTEITLININPDSFKIKEDNGKIIIYLESN